MVEINHVIITGQSNAVIGQNSELLGTATRGTELTKFFGGAREELYYSMPSRGFAYAAAPASYDLNVLTAAVSGQPYTSIKQGTSLYNGAIANLEAGVTTQTGLGHTVVARAIHVIHGEADDALDTPSATYLGYLSEWLTDYNTDCKTETGQATDLIGVCNQTSTSLDSLDIPTAQLEAQRTLDNWYCCGPFYALPNGGLHVTDAGAIYLGELHAKVYSAVVINAENWQPIHPTNVSQLGDQIRIRFHVPEPPLAFDTINFTAQTNMGFSYTDDTSSAAISSVAVTRSDEVTITLDGTPTGSNPRVQYGANLVGGNLRDSDPAVSIYNGTFPLYNWCCFFDDPVTQSARYSKRLVAVGSGISRSAGILTIPTP